MERVVIRREAIDGKAPPFYIDVDERKSTGARGRWPALARSREPICRAGGRVRGASRRHIQEEAIVIGKVLAPIFGLDEGAWTLAAAAEIGKHFHAHIEVVGAGSGLAGAESSRDGRASGSARAEQTDAASKGPPGATDDPRRVFDRWRHRHGLRLQTDSEHRRLASTAWVTLAGPADDELPRRAQFADLVCLGRKPDDREAPVSRSVEAMLFDSGRPVGMLPAIEGARVPPVLGEPIVVGWNGSVEAVHAVSAALPLMRISAKVEVVSLGEEAVNAMDAHDMARYLAWHGVRVSAAGIGRKDWTGGDFVAIATGRGARLLVMGAHRDGKTGALGGATRHMLEHMPMPVIMAA